MANEKGNRLNREESWRTRRDETEMLPHSQLASVNPRCSGGYPTSRHRQEPGASDPHPASRARGRSPRCRCGQRNALEISASPPPSRPSPSSHPAISTDAARIQPRPRRQHRSHPARRLLRLPRQPQVLAPVCHSYLFRSLSASASRSSVAE
jgi:hypothetical protein